MKLRNKILIGIAAGLLIVGGLLGTVWQDQTVHAYKYVTTYPQPSDLPKNAYKAVFGDPIQKLVVTLEYKYPGLRVLTIRIDRDYYIALFVQAYDTDRALFRPMTMDILNMINAIDNMEEYGEIQIYVAVSVAEDYRGIAEMNCVPMAYRQWEQATAFCWVWPWQLGDVREIIGYDIK